MCVRCACVSCRIGRDRTKQEQDWTGSVVFTNTEKTRKGKKIRKNEGKMGEGKMGRW